MLLTLGPTEAVNELLIPPRRGHKGHKIVAADVASVKKPAGFAGGYVSEQLIPPSRGHNGHEVVALNVARLKRVPRSAGVDCRAPGSQLDGLGSVLSGWPWRRLSLLGRPVGGLLRR